VKVLGLPANIRLCRKGLPGTNSLVYYKHSKIMDVKSLITLAQHAERAYKFTAKRLYRNGPRMIAF
jgi:hypothetical protein